jgi:anaerobic dimethyl sulfoxide reductase subunit A
VADWEEFKRTGIFFGPDRARVGLADFVADPLSRPLATPSGRVELAPESWARTGFPAVPSFRPQKDRPGFPLRLITPKSRYRVHSQNHNLAWSSGREVQELTINPLDAGIRGIEGGQEVTVESERGRMRVRARVSEEIMPGVVCLLEGAWPDLDLEGVDKAGSANVLTSTEPTRPSLSSRTHSVLVEVSKVVKEPRPGQDYGRPNG